MQQCRTLVNLYRSNAMMAITTSVWLGTRKGEALFNASSQKVPYLISAIALSRRDSRTPNLNHRRSEIDVSPITCGELSTGADPLVVASCRPTLILFLQLRRQNRPFIFKGCRVELDGTPIGPQAAPNLPQWHPSGTGARWSIKI
jgi:hypothetical protein